MLFCDVGAHLPPSQVLPAQRFPPVTKILGSPACEALIPSSPFWWERTRWEAHWRSAWEVCVGTETMCLNSSFLFSMYYFISLSQLLGGRESYPTSSLSLDRGNEGSERASDLPKVTSRARPPNSGWSELRVPPFLLQLRPPLTRVTRAASDLGSRRQTGPGERRGLGGRFKQRLSGRNEGSPKLEPSPDTSGEPGSPLCST